MARVAEAASVGLDVATAPNLKARDARLDEAVAQDDVDAARAALASFNQALAIEHNFSGDPIDAVSLAEKAVKAAVDGVLLEHFEAELPRLLDEADAAYHAAVERCTSLVHLVSRLPLSDEIKQTLRPRQRSGIVPSIHIVDGSMGMRVDTHWPQAENGTIGRDMAAVATVKARWTDAAARLAADADAELPA